MGQDWRKQILLGELQIIMLSAHWQILCDPFTLRHRCFFLSNAYHSVLLYNNNLTGTRNSFTYGVKSLLGLVNNAMFIYIIQSIAR